MDAEHIDSWAAALHEIARTEGALSAVEEDLFRFARTLETSDELRSVLADPAVPSARRNGVLSDLLGSASPVSAGIVSMIVTAGHTRDLPAIIDRLVARAATTRSAVVAEIRSAVPLDEGQRSRLADALGQAVGKTVEVKVIHDPSVLGGIVAQIGDTVMDGSVRTRLDQLKELL
ncbi:MAG: ATP synthase F1 subunit delta [Acidimicrobiales bacterium]